MLGKTEGNGGVNDFTREYALAALCEALSPHLQLAPRAVEDKIAFVMSGRHRRGALSAPDGVRALLNASDPRAERANSGKRLSIGIAHTRDFLPEEIGRTAQIEETVKAVHLAMRDAGIDDPHDVHFVQIKCPLLTSERIEAALHRGRKTVTTSGYASMGYSRGASALGVAIALGETQSRRRRGSGAQRLGFVFLGRLLLRRHRTDAQCGDRDGQFGRLAQPIRDRPRRDARLDRSCRRDGGARQRRAQRRRMRRANGRLVNIFAKAEASPDGCVRGFRHTMLDDSDVGSTRHARAAVGGLVAGLSGTGAVYVSGGAEHQGPPGGGPVAVIARV